MMQQQGERLARFLAHAGVASRRHAEDLIAAGRVQVNGVTVTTRGVQINPARDRIAVDGRLVQAATTLVYLLLNKPRGYVSTASDPQGRSTVLDLLPSELRGLRVYPVGRLDIDTGGLLLLTNDGDFALHISHPRYALEKEYRALVQGVPSFTALSDLRRGVTITEDDGRRHHTAPAGVQVEQNLGSTVWLRLTIHEGRKRQVRRMLGAVGYPVLDLIRVRIGSLELGAVSPGRWRHLTAEEVQMLLGKGSHT